VHAVADIHGVVTGNTVDEDTSSLSNGQNVDFEQIGTLLLNNVQPDQCVEIAPSQCRPAELDAVNVVTENVELSSSSLLSIGQSGKLVFWCLSHCFCFRVFHLSECIVQISQFSNQHFLILSDSLSCVEAIKNRNLQNPLIVEILERLHQKLNSNRSITFVWVPIHRHCR